MYSVLHTTTISPTRYTHSPISNQISPHNPHNPPLATQLRARRTPRRPRRRVSRIRLPTPIRSAQQCIIDCRVIRRATVCITRNPSLVSHPSKNETIAWYGETNLAPPLALLNHEQTSCEKQSWVYASPTAVPEHPAPQRPLQE
jgi:hypothetical protein